VELAAFTVGGVNESPYNLSQEAYEWPGNKWRASARYPVMDRATGEPLIAALVSLYGRKGTFLLGPVGAEATARGVATGTPVVSGANQEGKTLNTSGWTINITGILKAGDWVQLGSGATARLHKVLADVNSDGAGLATLDLWPRVGGARGIPANGSAIVVSSPKGVFRLSSDEVIWTLHPGQQRILTFEAEEAF
jgi:hypothetical protein